ncbi:GNAT family N-acetyltransferase [Bacillus sp. AK031]
MNNKIGIRKMMEEDLSLMGRWLSTDKVYEFYSNNGKPLSSEEVANKYLPRIKGSSTVVPYIFQYGEQPSGYLQMYPSSSDELKDWGYPEGTTVWGMDCFIGEPSLFNKGLGTRMVDLFTDHIIREANPDYIVLDPSITNKRAIRCYEKAGFTQKMTLKEGLFLLMELDCRSKRNGHPF